MHRPENIRFADRADAVSIVDQRKLPGQKVRLELSTVQECRAAIESLAVRGAPAIGIFAAFSLAVLARKITAKTYEEFSGSFSELADYIEASRPTAVNLQHVCDRMRAVVASPTHSVHVVGLWDRARAALVQDLYEEALAIQQEDAAACETLAELGLALVKDGDGIITHCNAGPLATSSYGTALGPVLLGTERGMRFHVYACETRPLLQGARLTAYELMQAGVDVTLICDSMASVCMQQGKVQACFVGADRVAANGDVANKVGTCQLAIAAAHYQVPFYVVCPTSTIDAHCATGADIPIEQRPAEEVTHLHFSEPVAPDGIDVFNPAFDVTSHDLITAIVTEKGVFGPSNLPLG